MRKLTTPKVPERTVVHPTPVTGSGWTPKRDSTKDENVEVFHRRTRNVILSDKTILYTMRKD